MCHSVIAEHYCGRRHRLSDGRPLNHRCRLLPVLYLQAQAADDVSLMLDLWGDGPEIILDPGLACGDCEEPEEPEAEGLDWSLSVNTL